VSNWSLVYPIMLPMPPGHLCSKPYHGHPRGCPNYGKPGRQKCPPQTKLFDLKYAASNGGVWYVVWNVFDLAAHREHMRAKHPTWTERQLVNCLYWQGTARKQLRSVVRDFCLRYNTGHDNYIVYVPEAHGVDVTATMRQAHQYLQWPPDTLTYQVAMAYVEYGCVQPAPVKVE